MLRWDIVRLPSANARSKPTVPSHSLKLTLTNSLSTNTPPALMHMKAGSKMLRMTRNKADLQLQEMDVSRCGTLILKVLVLYPLRPLFFH